MHVVTSAQAVILWKPPTNQKVLQPELKESLLFAHSKVTTAPGNYKQQLPFMPRLTIQSALFIWCDPNSRERVDFTSAFKSFHPKVMEALMF